MTCYICNVISILLTFSDSCYNSKYMRIHLPISMQLKWMPVYINGLHAMQYLYGCSRRMDDPAALWPHVVTRWKHCKDTQTRSLREGQLLRRLIRKRWSTSHAQTDGVQQKKSQDAPCYLFPPKLQINSLLICFYGNGLVKYKQLTCHFPQRWQFHWGQ